MEEKIVDWINLAPGTNYWRALMDTVMNPLAYCFHYRCKYYNVIEINPSLKFKQVLIKLIKNLITNKMRLAI